VIKDFDWFFENLKNKNNFCYVRYNDGEMMGISRIGAIAARGDQVIDKQLHDKLTSGILHRQEDYYIGIPCSTCFPKYHKLAEQMTAGYDKITSAVLLTNKNWKSFYDNFPSACRDRNIIWVGGKSQSKEKLLDYGLNIKKMIRVTEKNSWSFYDKLKNAIPSLISENDIVSMSLGPTARVLCKELFEQYPNVTFLDLGSLLDPVTKGVYFSAHKGWEETGFNLQKRCSECN
jgi:hypothetical protein